MAISHHVRVAKVIIAEYPAFLFTDDDMRYDGCGVFGFIDKDDAEWLTAKGLQLNEAISKAARRNRWIYARGVAHRFRGHGYRASSSATWFRGFVESRDVQDDELGTAHPNVLGHREMAAELRDAVPRSFEAPG